MTESKHTPDLRTRLRRCGCPDCMEAVALLDLLDGALMKLTRAIQEYEAIPVQFWDDEAWLFERLGELVAPAYLTARAAIAKATGQ